jgi:hypothetical protein
MTAPLPDRNLRRKLTLRAHGEQVVLVKKPGERMEHVLMKAFLWALYLPQYDSLAVEVGIGDTFKPDVVRLDARGEPVFWAEAGKVSPAKLASLVKRFPRTHFAWGRWGRSLHETERLAQRAVTSALKNRALRAPIDLYAFPPESADRFVEADGTITITSRDVPWKRLGPEPH